MATDLEQIKTLCAQYALTFKEPSPGHVQVSGHGVLVNYWPTSKRRTAHRIGSDPVPFCEPFDVIKLAMAKGEAVSLRPKAAKHIEKQKAPPPKSPPKRSGNAGVVNLYSGEIPPWEFKSFVSSASDNLRMDAWALENQAMMLRAEAFDMEQPA
jgi:hypothetical protein